MTNFDRVYDLIIIGAGPTGLFGLFYASVRELDTLLIDSLAEPGGQLTALYPEKYIYDMPGFPKILAKDLVSEMLAQATMHRHQDMLLGERVETLVRDETENVIRLTTHKGRKLTARTVVITTGAGAFRPHKIAVDGAEALEDKSVFYTVKHIEAFRGKNVVVIGGGDSAMDWVLALHEVAAEISLVHRRDKFRAHEESVSKIMSFDHVKKFLHYEVKGFAFGAGGEMEQVLIENNQTQTPLMLRADALVVSMGFSADIGPMKTWGIDLDHTGIIVNSSMETNIPGVYAAGDVTRFSGKLKLIATGVGEAAIAVNTAKHFIDPHQRVQPVHSSSLFEGK